LISYYKFFFLKFKNLILSGGYFGLFLGASFLTAGEFFELILTVIRIIFQKRVHKKNEITPNS